MSTWKSRTRVDQARRADDDAGHHVAVAGQILRGGLDDEVGPELDRPADVRRGERVVDEVRGAVAMGQVGQGDVIGDDDRRVGDRLRVQDPGRRGGQGRLDRGEIADVDEVDRDPSRPNTVASWDRVVPYTARVATIRSPADRSVPIAPWIAPIPEAKANPASAPSSSATAEAKATTVGLSRRP